MLKNLEEKIVVLFLILLICLVFFAAVLRTMGISISWSIDIAQPLFVWVCFLGADIALKSNSHIGVDLLLKKLPLKLQGTINFAWTIGEMLFLFVVLWFGVKLSIENYKRNFNTLPISYSLATISAPVGSLLMELTLVKRIKNNFANLLRR